MNPPLYIKYIADGQKSLLDTETGQLFKVTDAIYNIIDDYRRLPLEEIVQKHSELSESEVRAAYQELEDNRLNHSVLVDHPPVEAASIGQIICRGGTFTLEEFLTSFSSMIILGVTERCNLRCEYCCYSGHFEGHRAHANRSMSFEIAQKAVFQHLHTRQKEDLCGVSFYGGEPLLEFDLIKKVVAFAEEEAKQVEKDLVFSITTNGTLLDDEKIHFLVDHKFLILISLDGPKEAHDRYRVFAGEERNGSFDIVSKNIRRFIELYPEYLARGLSVTLAPPIRWQETEDLLKEWYPKFHLTRLSLVNTGNKDFADGRKGCPSPSECEVDGKMSYQFFSDKDEEVLAKEFHCFIEALQNKTLEELTAEMPLHSLLFGPRIKSIHKRQVTAKPQAWPFSVPCLPGFARRFCDTEGRYHICERVDSSERFTIGDVWNGLNTDKINNLLAWYSTLVDCPNCSSKKICDHCFASVLDADQNDDTLGLATQRKCSSVCQRAPDLLAAYTKAMNRNKKTFVSTDVHQETKNKMYFVPLTDMKEK